MVEAEKCAWVCPFLFEDIKSTRHCEQHAAQRLVRRRALFLGGLPRGALPGSSGAVGSSGMLDPDSVTSP